LSSARLVQLQQYSIVLNEALRHLNSLYRWAANPVQERPGFDQLILLLQIPV
jgi:hypothetical protein